MANGVLLDKYLFGVSLRENRQDNPSHIAYESVLEHWGA
jgi:hypothetical protein